MNKEQIEEIALRVANACFFPEMQPKAHHYINFAHALLEELAKQSEPVAVAECKVVHGHECQFLNRTSYGMSVLKKNGDKLYTHPLSQPDLVAEQQAPSDTLYGVLK